MTMRHAIAVTLALVLFAACGQKEQKNVATRSATQTKTVASTMTPEEMGELGAQITHQPERAKELLSQHGMTPEEFEREIRHITENPEASRRYAAAYKKTKA